MEDKKLYDEEGRLTEWPADEAERNAAVEKLGALFEKGNLYSEDDLAAIVKEHIAFDDAERVCRALMAAGLFRKQRDSSVHWTGASLYIKR